MTEISAPSDPSTNVTRSVPPPFFALPSWWRRFLFWTLRPREITVYLYIVSLLDKNGTAFPTQAQVAYEMNLAGTDQIANAMETLERNGFIQRTRAKLEGRRTSSERTIYSRPAVEFTLITLLDRGKIDGDLYPTNKKSELLRDELDTTESAVELGLRNLLGTDRYTTYLSEKASSAALRAQLVLSLEARLGHPVETLGIEGRREGDNDRYRAWIEAVFAAICERLDGDPEQTGSSRHYGNANFSITMDYKRPYGEGDLGVVQCAVTLRNQLASRTPPRAEKYSWRTNSPEAVAEELVRNYKALETAA